MNPIILSITERRHHSLSIWINLMTLSPYKLPTNVLNTAVEAPNLSDPLDIRVDNVSDNNEYYVYLHFL